MTVKSFVKYLVCLLVLHCSEARPTGNGKMTMSGEPTHFQVDDKAAELEINANAMGVKVNAKPASLQVVSKPGTPAIAVPHPAVVAPQFPGPYMAPYYPAPIYPSPMIVGHRRTVRRRHHFYDMNPSVGNWNFKKEKIPEKSTEKTSDISNKTEQSKRIYKKSEISKNTKKSKVSQKTENSRKRQWIQRIPVLPQAMSYSPYPVTNTRVHPLVQRLLAASQAAMRASVARPMYGYSPRTYSPWGQRFYYNPPGYSMGLGQTIGETRGAIHRAIFLPALPGYQNMQALSPLATIRQPWSNPRMLNAPAAGLNGYYDPIITRGFIPDFSSPSLPRVQAPTVRTLIPNGMPGGLMYTGYTPLVSGTLQILSKRLTIPHTKAKQAKTKRPGKSTSEKENTDNSRAKRSTEETEGKKMVKDLGHHHNRNAKRQFILTQPVVQPVQQPIVAYVPVVTSPSLQPPMMTSPVGRNFVLNLPERTPGTFALNVPSPLQHSQMYTPTPGGMELSQPHNSGQFNVLPENQPNYVAMATQRSSISQQGFGRYGVPQGLNRIPLGEITGIMGTPIVRQGPHITMVSNGELSPHVQDEIFRENSLQGRARIPRRKSLHHRHRFDEDYYATDYPARYSDYTADLYDNPSRNVRIEDKGSYTERVLPDGRRVFRKDHVGFGPITVEAHTAESALRHNDDAIDMDLDSDKRKRIPRPERMERRRLEIPRPEAK